MIAYILIALGFLMRLVPHVPNTVPVAAIAIFAGAYLNKIRPAHDHLHGIVPFFDPAAAHYHVFRITFLAHFINISQSQRLQPCSSLGRRGGRQR